MSENVFQGSLFSSDFLNDSITRLADWSIIQEPGLKALQSDLRKIYDRFPIKKTPNESQTEDDLIWLILARLGWTATLRQQNLAAKGRGDVPDGILFADDAAKAKANTSPFFWLKDSRPDRPRCCAGTDLHIERHGPLRLRHGLCGG
jgi:hypothetical protein